MAKYGRHHPKETYALTLIARLVFGVPRAESRENIEGIPGLGLRKAAAVVLPLSLIQTSSYGEWEVEILSWETELDFLDSGGHASEAYVRGFDRWLCKGLPSAPIKSDAVNIKLCCECISHVLWSLRDCLCDLRFVLDLHGPFNEHELVLCYEVDDQVHKHGRALG